MPDLITKENRLILIRHLLHTESIISTSPLAEHSTQVKLDSDGQSDVYYMTEPLVKVTSDEQVYLLPILLEKDGTPWHLGNLFLLDLATNPLLEMAYKDTREIRRKASALLDYKIFCEEQVDRFGNALPINLFDFRHQRKSSRPTWRYYNYLRNSDRYSNAVINMKTGAIYQFYKFSAKQPDVDLDIERVDTLTKFSIYIDSVSGSVKVDRVRRGQTLNVPSEQIPVDVNYVKDEGEQLRPLQDSELKALMEGLDSSLFSADEKLMHYFSLCTGERKQSILTLRMKHLKYFTEKHRLSNGSYKMTVAPRDGCDTKFSIVHKLIVPKRLADALITFATSQKAEARREKFREKNGDVLSEDDMYIFLSPTGNCRYMSKTDPRFRMTKTPETGQVTRHMKHKILTQAGSKIAPDFTFHWLRATFALKLYRKCLTLVEKGKMKAGDELDYVRRRMHHKKRETTENYLKLFSTVDERLSAQELYEDSLFEDVFKDIEVNL